MRTTKFWTVLQVLTLAFVQGVSAQVPPAEQLLPEDTIALITTPDYRKLEQHNDQSPWGKLWADPAMKPFRENFLTNFQKDFVEPLEREIGINFREHQDLLQGQITLAFTPPAEGSDDAFGLLLLLDSKDQSGKLATFLESLKKKWIEQGKELKTEKIRDIEFNTIVISGADIDSLLQKVFPKSEESEPEELGDPKKIELHIGQFKSLLVVGENPKAIEKILARQSGGLVPPLAEQASFQKSQQQLFRDSLGYAWINVKPIYARMMESLSQPQEEPPPGMPNLKMDKILPALGFDGLETISANLSGTAGGTSASLLVAVPEARREGLFKMLAFEKKEAAPPAFVPANAIQFQRVRLDSQKAWAALETMLMKIDPSIAGMLQLMLSSAGKEQDPNFDLKKNLIGNLGDDFMTYQKAPKTSAAADLASPPTLVLIGSPNSDQLVDAFRMVMSMMPPPLSSTPLQEREFLGKKIYSVTHAIPAVPTETAESAPAGERTMSFTASAGYLAFSTDNAILEEYLRSAEATGKTLRETPGLAQAIEKVGGTELGLFTFEDQAETWRILFKALKENPETLNSPFLMGAGGPDSRVSRLVNVKLLPEYDAIAKYFFIAVASGTVTPEGFLFQAYGPTPPALR